MRGLGQGEPHLPREVLAPPLLRSFLWAPDAAPVVGCARVRKCEKKEINSGSFVGTSTSLSPFFFFLFFPKIHFFF